MSRRVERLPIWLRAEPVRRKPRFTREAIAAAAFAIADAKGFEAVSMRGIAAKLGAGTMTLYHYVRTKDDLVALMDDALMGEILIPAAISQVGAPPSPDRATDARRSAPSAGAAVNAGAPGARYAPLRTVSRRALVHVTGPPRKAHLSRSSMTSVRSRPSPAQKDKAAGAKLAVAFMHYATSDRPAVPRDRGVARDVDPNDAADQVAESAVTREVRAGSGARRAEVWMRAKVRSNKDGRGRGGLTRLSPTAHRPRQVSATIGVRRAVRRHVAAVNLRRGR